MELGLNVDWSQLLACRFGDHIWQRKKTFFEWNQEIKDIILLLCSNHLTFPIGVQCFRWPGVVRHVRVSSKSLFVLKLLICVRQHFIHPAKSNVYLVRFHVVVLLLEFRHVALESVDENSELLVPCSIISYLRSHCFLLKLQRMECLSEKLWRRPTLTA